MGWEIWKKSLGFWYMFNTTLSAYNQSLNIMIM